MGMKWAWLRIQELGQTAGFSLWLHLPRGPFGYFFLSHSQMGPFVCALEDQRASQLWILLLRRARYPGVLVHTFFLVPLGQMNPKASLKRVYTPYEVGWKPGKPRRGRTRDCSKLHFK